MREDVLRLDQRVGKLESHFDQARRDIEQIRTSPTKILSRGEQIGELELEAVEREAEQVAPPPPHLATATHRSEVQTSDIPVTNAPRVRRLLLENKNSQCVLPTFLQGRHKFYTLYIL